MVDLDASVHHHSEIVTLQMHLQTLFSRGMDGINDDFMDIPDLIHMRALPGISLMVDLEKETCMCLRMDRAKMDGPLGPSLLSSSIPLMVNTNTDAWVLLLGMWTTALECVNKLPWTLKRRPSSLWESLRWETATKKVRFLCNFDAQTAGFGATGAYNVACSVGAISQRQLAARILMTVLERKLAAPRGIVVGQAHQGHPWNEMVDSIAKAVWHGWTPPIAFTFKSGELLRHSLAQWAWLDMVGSSPRCRIA